MVEVVAKHLADDFASYHLQFLNSHFCELCQGRPGNTFGSVGTDKKSDAGEVNSILLGVEPDYLFN